MRILLISLLPILLCGCSTFQTKLPNVLVTSELQWTIPKGVPFKAIQKPAYPKLTEFTVADQDLAIISKGNLMELEAEANRRAVKGARQAKTQGMVWGALGSLLSVLGGLFAKNKLSKKKEVKNGDR